MKAAGDKVHPFACRRESLAQEAFPSINLPKHSKLGLNITAVYTSTGEVDRMTLKLLQQGAPCFLPCPAAFTNLPAPQEMAVAGGITWPCPEVGG